MTARPNIVRLDREPAEIKAPANPRRPILIGLVVIAAAFGGFGVWAALAPLDSAAVAPGVVSVESNRKSVQHLEGGIVEEILVREGQFVRQGDILIRLDDTQARAMVKTLQARLDAARALGARLLAERDGLVSIRFPADLVTRLDDPTVKEIAEGQRRQFEERRRSLEGQVSILKQRTKQAEQEIAGLRAQEVSKRRQHEIFTEELVGLRELYEKGYYPRTRVLAIEREVAGLEGDRGANLAAIARAQQAIGEVELRIIQMRQGIREDVVNQLHEVRNEINDVKERLVVGRDVLRRIDIRAPQTGTAQALKVHTKGGVAAPGAELMQIIPLDDRLVIEAQVSPVDIDSVAEGQKAEIRLTAFKMRTTPIIEGKVVSISADRLTDERTNAAYYLARIEVPDDQLAVLGERKLQAGMPAQVLIKTGSRTVLDYLLKPLDDALARGLKEE